MKKLVELSPGSLFRFAGERFVVLEQRGSETFVLLAQSKESCAFRADMNGEERNNYVTSGLKKRIDEWVGSLPRGSKEAAAIHEFEVDLNCTDRSGGYGTLTGVRAAPLTLWQYGQFKDLIPLNVDDYWWLATPWACRWLRSPNTNNSDYVWYVNTDGGCNVYDASNSFGIRPALVLDSGTTVSLDGDMRFFEIDLFRGSECALSMCIKGTREPVDNKELSDFLRTDMLNEQADRVEYVYELSEEEARHFYDFDSFDSWPVFGETKTEEDTICTSTTWLLNSRA